MSKKKSKRKDKEKYRLWVLDVDNYILLGKVKNPSYETHSLRFFYELSDDYDVYAEIAYNDFIKYKKRNNKGYESKKQEVKNKTRRFKLNSENKDGNVTTVITATGTKGREWLAGIKFGFETMQGKYVKNEKDLVIWYIVEEVSPNSLVGITIRKEYEKEQ